MKQNTALGRLRERRQQVGAEIVESQKRLVELLRSGGKTPAVDGVSKAAGWVDRFLLVYNGVRVGLRIVSLARIFIPKRRRRR